MSLDLMFQSIGDAESMESKHLLGNILTPDKIIQQVSKQETEPVFLKLLNQGKLQIQLRLKDIADIQVCKVGNKQVLAVFYVNLELIVLDLDKIISTFFSSRCYILQKKQSLFKLRIPFQDLMIADADLAQNYIYKWDIDLKAFSSMRADITARTIQTSLGCKIFEFKEQRGRIISKRQSVDGG